jgi:hypothetical protein
MSTQEVIVQQSLNSIVVAGGVPYRERSPLTEAYFFSDFVNDLTPFCFCSGTQSTNTVNGTVTTLTANVIDNRIGVAQVLLDTDASGALIQGSRGGLYLAKLASAWSLDRTMSFGKDFDFSARVKVGSSNASTFKMAIGFCETHGQPSTTNHITNGPAFVIEGVDTIRTSVAVATVETRIDTGVDPTSMRTYRITGTATILESGNILNTFKFYLDGVLIRTAENVELEAAVAVLPTIEMRDRQTGGTTGTATFDVDYMSFQTAIDR